MKISSKPVILVLLILVFALGIFIGIDLISSQNSLSNVYKGLLKERKLRTGLVINYSKYVQDLSVIPDALFNKIYDNIEIKSIKDFKLNLENLLKNYPDLVKDFFDLLKKIKGIENVLNQITSLLKEGGFDSAKKQYLTLRKLNKSVAHIFKNLLEKYDGLITKKTADIKFRKRKIYIVLFIEYLIMAVLLIFTAVIVFNSNKV